MVTRREAILASAALGGAATIMQARAAVASQIDAAGRGWQKSYSGKTFEGPPLPPGEPGKHYKPTVTPNGAALPWKVVDGVKIYHLIAEETWHEFAPGLKARCWGYNGRVHGPTIEAVEGDRVRIYVTNKLIAPTSVHWHGVFLPNGMDGVGGLNQRAIAPGETFKYEWTWRQHGTFMYHAHHDEMTQMALGMLGMIVVHPRNPSAGYRVDRDFVLLLSEWRIDPGASRPHPNEMSDFKARIAVARSEAAITRSREELNGLMGLWGSAATWRVVGRLPDPSERALDVVNLESRAVARSIDLALTRGRFAAAAARINAGYPAAWLPDLRGGVGAEREDGDWEVGPRVALELPLFYQGQGTIARGKAEMRRQQHLKADVAVLVRAQARSLATSLLSAREQVTFYRTVLLPLRARIVSETQLQFNAMTIGVFQLLQAKRDQVEAGRAYVEALRDYWIRRAGVDQLLAGRLLRAAPETTNPMDEAVTEGAPVQRDED